MVIEREGMAFWPCLLKAGKQMDGVWAQVRRNDGLALALALFATVHVHVGGIANYQFQRFYLAIKI